MCAARDLLADNARLYATLKEANYPATIAHARLAAITHQELGALRTERAILLTPIPRHRALVVVVPKG